jgi:hypothetical protein
MKLILISLTILFFLSCGQVDHKFSGEIKIMVDDKICDLYIDQKQKEKCQDLLLLFLLTDNLDKSYCDEAYDDPIDKRECQKILLDILRKYSK